MTRRMPIELYNRDPIERRCYLIDDRFPRS